MKKTIFTFCCVFMAGLLSACGGGIDDRFKDEPDFDVLTGIMTGQESGDKFRGTHLLTEDDGKATALKSLSINLGGRQYLDNRVELTGVFNPEEEVFEVTGIKVLEILSDKKVPEPKFIDYRNPDLGFNLKYYDDWSVEENEDRVVFSAPSDMGVEVIDSSMVVISQEPFHYQPRTNDDGSTDTPLRTFRENVLDLNKAYASKEPEKNQIGVDRIESLKYESGAGYEYFVYRSGLIYRIAFIPAEKESPESLIIFNKMLSEFRFTGFDVEDGEESLTEVKKDKELPVIEYELNSFESLPYYFGAKYPSRWYYAGSAGSGDILRRYSFSDEPLDDDDANAILFMDVISTDPPESPITEIDGQDFIETTSATGQYAVYTTVKSQKFRVSGPSDYKELILVMAHSIVPIEQDSTQ